MIASVQVTLQQVIGNQRVTCFLIKQTFSMSNHKNKMPFDSSFLSASYIRHLLMLQAIHILCLLCQLNPLLLLLHLLVLLLFVVNYVKLFSSQYHLCCWDLNTLAHLISSIVIRCPLNAVELSHPFSSTSVQSFIISWNQNQLSKLSESVRWLFQWIAMEFCYKS